MKYFTIEELCRSGVALKKGITNRPDGDITINLSLLVQNILDPLRQSWGEPIIVTSGYRCPALNKAVGGAKNSTHMRGEAADIVSGGGRKGIVYNMLLGKTIVRELPFDKVIFEDCEGDTLRCSWIHVSFSKSGNRGIILKKPKGKNVYIAVTPKEVEKG